MKRDQMRIKSYFAKSVDQAMAQAREELGAEAMLLNTRKAPADRSWRQHTRSFLEWLVGSAGWRRRRFSLPVPSGGRSRSKTLHRNCTGTVWSDCTSKSMRFGTLLLRSSRAQLDDAADRAGAGRCLCALDVD